MEEREYILGTEREEIERLRFQHQAWIEQAYALWTRAGLRAGHAVIDLGCGPGFTSFELAHVVGPEGRVVARDLSARFLAFLEREGGRLGLDWIETSLGPVEELELPAESLDAAYARWLLCWLADARSVLAHVARSLVPGGAIVLQEYLDWAGMKLLPRSEIFDRGVEACMQSWAEGGATIDFAERVPALASSLDLRLELFEPRARLGGVGSLEWRWITRFFASYLPKLVQRGLFGAHELEAWRGEVAERAREGRSYCVAPTMADIVLRK